MARFPAPAVLFALAACRSQAPAWTLPRDIEGRWRLTATPPGADGFGLAGPIARKKSVIGSYEDGSAKLLVFAFEQANGAAAFEQVQKWRAQPGKIVFHRGAWFVVVESPKLSVAELSHLGSVIEKSMPD